MDPIEKAKESMGGFEKFVSKLPGIKGYREKDMRREADKRVREGLAEALEAVRRQFSGMQNDLLASGGLLWMDDMERVVGRLQLLIDRVKTAAYGYTPFFDLDKVKEDELDRLIEYDQSLFDGIPRLETAVGKVAEAIEANEGIKEAIKAVGELLANMNETFGRRMESIKQES
ncbi:MAG: hypothetical protein AB2L09_13375 [Coriobacteriia bacterium]